MDGLVDLRAESLRQNNELFWHRFAEEIAGEALTKDEAKEVLDALRPTITFVPK